MVLDELSWFLCLDVMFFDMMCVCLWKEMTSDDKFKNGSSTKIVVVELLRVVPTSVG